MSNFSGRGNGVEAWGNTVTNWGSSNTGMGSGSINLGAGSKSNHMKNKFRAATGNPCVPPAFSSGSVNLGPGAGGKNGDSASGYDSGCNRISGELWGVATNPGDPYAFPHGPGNYGPGAGRMNAGPAYGCVDYFSGSQANWAPRFPHGGTWPGHFFGTWQGMPKPGDGFWYSGISPSWESDPNAETPRRAREGNECNHLFSHK
ncbi:hypothetical protein SLE2022_164860 [Rubroshorea leprosula]